MPEATPIAAFKPKRRWFQYSLRTLFIVTAIVACLATVAHHWYSRVREELDAVEGFRLRGLVFRIEEYNFSLHSILGRDETEADVADLPPRWFLALIGKSDFRHIRQIQIFSLSESARTKDYAELADRLAKLKGLVSLQIGFRAFENPDVNATLRRMPQLQCVSIFGTQPPYGLNDFAAPQLPSLKVQPLADLLVSKSIDTLTLRDVNVVPAVAKLPLTQTQLKEVAMFECAMTGESRGALEQSPRFDVRRGNCNWITDE